MIRNFLVQVAQTVLPEPLVALLRIPSRLKETEKQTQMLARFLLSQAGVDIMKGTEINRHELKVFSQNGEDGVIHHLFSRIGTTSRVFVEFGFGNGRECNSANLLLNCGWRGLFMDCNARRVESAARYFSRRLGDRCGNVTVANCFVTRENINELFLQHGFSEGLDLLSIDVDGNDYWIWEGVTAVRPRVVVVEYNAVFGPERSITVQYDPRFNRHKKHASGFYFGASLAALTKLAHKKGYLLAGCESSGVNAFFVLEEAAKGVIDEASVAEAYFPLAHGHEDETPDEQFERVKDLKFVHI